MTDSHKPMTTFVEVNGVKLTVYEWPGNDPAVFFVHATGFHGRCWDAVIHELPDRRCLAIDVRGHGHSEISPPPYSWATLGIDVATIVQTMGLQAAVGVGHSMGGHLLVQAAARIPGAFAGLLLIEPVIFPRSLYSEPQQTEEHFAARRRNHWQSPEEMLDRFINRLPFSSWQPQVLRDYCFQGLRPAPEQEGGYVLACPPAVEAALYTGATHPDADIYPLLGQINMPAWVIRAGAPFQSNASDMRASPTAPDLALAFPQGQDEHFPAHSHFLPMEAPALVAARVDTLIEQLGATKPE